MKQSYLQLLTSLKHTLLPIYIVSGEEPFLKQEAINKIKQAANKALFNERILFRVKDDNCEQLYTSLYAWSLEKKKRLFELDLRDHLPDKNMSQILTQYANKPLEDTLLLINMNKIDTKLLKSTWLTTLEKKGVLITIWPVTKEQLPQWITQYANEKYQLQIKLNDANFLADLVEGNCAAAMQALEKIKLMNTPNIDKSLILNILEDESHFTIFDFLNYLLLGEKETLIILTKLKNEGVEPILVLWHIAKELRLLSNLLQEKKAGKSLSQLLQEHRIYFQRKNAVTRFLNTFTEKDVWEFIEHAAEIDNIIKGSSVGDVWQTLQIFCLRLL